MASFMIKSNSIAEVLTRPATQVREQYGADRGCGRCHVRNKHFCSGAGFLSGISTFCRGGSIFHYGTPQIQRWVTFSITVLFAPVLNRIDFPGITSRAPETPAGGRCVSFSTDTARGSPETVLQASVRGSIPLEGEMNGKER